MSFKKSRFYQGLVPEQFSFITGINETVEEKMLIRPHTRYIMAATDYADGVSFRKLGLSTDGFGFGRLPFDNTAFASGYGRGMGLFQLYGSAVNFATYFATPFPQSAAYPNNTVNELDQWNFTGTKTTLATLNGPSSNPVGTQLVSNAYGNFLNVYTDYQYLNAIWNLSGTPTNTALIQQGAAPALAAVTTGPFTYSSQFGSYGAPFSNPIGIATDSSGNIFVADFGNSTIYKFNSSGVQQSFTLSGSTLSHPEGLYIDSSGNIFVCDTGNALLKKFDSSGAFQWASSGVSLSTPSDVYADGSGNLWVVSRVNNFIYKFNSSGVYQSVSFQASGTGSPQPVGIYIDGSNNMYVTVQNGSLPGVQKFNSSGVYQSNFTGYTFAPVGATGIIADGSGNFYVVDQANNCFSIFNSSGVFQNTIGSAGSGNGQFNYPTFIAFITGHLYVADLSNFRIQNFTNAATGSLSGYYGYCYTFVDKYGNESQPSMFMNIDNLTTKNVTLTITPGANVTQTVWATIRIYRTVTNTSTVLASQNPTFWHVPGLDIVVTGATTYTVTDSVPDTGISPNVTGSTIASNYTLKGESAVINASYANGALQALPVGSVPKFLVPWNGSLWGGFWSVSGTTYPIRVFWSATNDNSGLSAGNSTNWNSLNYLDVGTVDDGNIIGMWPGLQGVLYVFKEFSTYIIQATGSTSGIIYSATAISSEYGLYHHSIAEIGGSVVGRTKDNIATFNGTSYKLLGNANLIRKTVNRCITPEADSGVFDTNKQRYYLAVCDTSLTGSFQTEVNYGSGPTETTNLINAYRNTVLAFDMTTDSFEIHKNEPIQVFGKLKDNGGRERIFALGMSSDIFILFEGNFFGCDFSFVGTVPTGDTSGLNIQGPVVTTGGGTVLPNAFLAIPYFINADGTVQFLDYLTTTSGSSQPSGTACKFPVYNQLPIGNTDLSMMVMISNQVDTVISGNTSVLTNFNTGAILTNNNTGALLTENTNTNGSITLKYGLYQNSNMKNFSLYNITQGVFLSSMNGGWQVGATNQTIQPSNTTQPSGPIFPGDQVILVPSRCYNNLANNGVPMNAFMTPPMGSRLNDTARKAFYSFRMQVKGSGTLNIYGFKDGNQTYLLGPNLCTPDEVKTVTLNSNATTQLTVGNFTLPLSYQQMVYLKNLVGYYYRTMIWMPRGSGWFEIQDFTNYYRLMEEFSSL